MKTKRFLAALTFYVYNNFISNIPSYTLRNFYLRTILRIKLGRSTAVHMGCFFTGRHIEIGNHSVINRNCFLDGRIGIEIGDNVSISPEVFIISLTHNPQDEQFRVFGDKTIIKDYVWIGARAIINPGITLSTGCVVGSGAVVTKSFPPYSILAGVPAKIIGERNHQLNYQINYFPYFNSDIQPE